MTMGEQAARRVPILRGERVYLRPAERDDLPRFVEWLSDAETAHYLGPGAPLSLPLEERWFERMLEAQGRSDYHFVICLRETDEPIGTISLHGVDLANGSAAFGIAVGAKDRWGQGLGTDATNAIVDFGFGELRLERIELDVYDYNRRGRRAYEKAGFVFEATRRRAHFHRGQHHDVHVMSILRDEWLALPRARGWDLE
jgi:RimJ/RimL family protein N-acetyltransferase